MTIINRISRRLNRSKPVSNTTENARSLMKKGDYYNAAAMWLALYRQTGERSDLINLCACQLNDFSFFRTDTIINFIENLPRSEADPELQVYRAGLYLINRKPDVCSAILADAKKIGTIDNKSLSIAYYLEALIYFKQESYGNARERLERSVEHDNTNWLAGTVRTKLMRDQFNLSAAEALPILERQIAGGDRADNTYFLFAMALVETGKRWRAFRTLAREIRRRPDDFMPLLNMSAVHYKAGNFIRASYYYTKQEKLLDPSISWITFLKMILLKGTQNPTDQLK